MTLSRRVSLLLAVLYLAVLSTPSTFAQGTTGSLTGTVTSAGAPLPGVSVMITSASLQGSRTAVTGESGGYDFPSLPPGEYRVHFELQGMSTLDRMVRINLTQSSRADADLRVSAVSESISITAAAPAVLESQQIAQSFTTEQLNMLPTERTIASTTLLAPGVNDAGPNNQIVISGAQSFDNLFLVNGVTVNENLRGQPQNLFIEDAIQETTVMTGAISAEYGRFTGGVVSTVTKSGGNEFSGSVRDTFTNDNWTSKTNFVGQANPLDTLNNSYEATLGGRILRDRLWFFLAGKKRDISSENQTRITLIPFAQADNDKRYEAKLTGQFTNSQSLVASYISRKRLQTNLTGGSIVDLASLSDRPEPSSLLSLHYSGVLTRNLLLEGQYSRMNNSFSQGGNSHDPILGTLLIDDNRNLRGFSPTFCGTACPPKQRDNKSSAAKASYFLSTKSAGDHSFVVGGEDFHQLRNENNYQSGSDFRVHGSFLFDTPGSYHFSVSPDDGQIEYDPVPALSQTSDFAVRSFFVNDRWNLNPSWTFNAGVRYDQDRGKDQAGNKTVDDSIFTPRLGATYDLGGKGKHRFTATYSKYASKVDQGPADNTAAAGRYASYYWDYKGPAINPTGTPAALLVSNADVIKQVFAWFNSVGGTKNTEFLTSTHVPGITLQFRESLRAPNMTEMTFGYGVALNPKAYVRADFIHRDWRDFYTVRRTLDTGIATDGNGTRFDIGIIENGSTNLTRKYDGLQTQWNWQILQPLSFGGNYTYSKLKGNVEGESASGATGFLDINNYPQYTNFANNKPNGYLSEDMRHRSNAWLDWSVPVGFGNLSLNLLERYHSALPYSAVSTIDVRNNGTTGPANGIANPGYVRPPSSVTYYFSGRGAYRVDSVFSTNIGVRYSIPVRAAKITLFADLLNAFNQQSIEDPDFIDLSIRTRRNGAAFLSGKAAKAFNPYSETPIEGVNYEKSAKFGQPTSPSAYQTPRTYRFALRVSF
ncbi:MAG: TonB-dependent receptor [Acidobacteriota bacterium]